MFNPLVLLSRAKSGEIGLDELSELLAVAGVELDHAGPVEGPNVKAAFTRAAGGAVVPGSKVLALAGRIKSGGRIDAVIVVSPALSHKSVTAVTAERKPNS